MLLRSDDLVTFMLGTPPPPPPLHPIIHKIIKKNNLFCNCNVQMSFESWGLNSNPHTMCMDIIYPKPKYRSFCNISYLTLPQIYATCTRPIQEIISSIYYGMIGNYPSFKMIPNTTYIVLILKKYNRSKSSLLTLCAGNIIFRWRRCVYIKQKNMPILCAPMKLRLCRWKNTW